MMDKEKTTIDKLLESLIPEELKNRLIVLGVSYGGNDDWFRTRTRLVFNTGRMTGKTLAGREGKEFLIKWKGVI